MKIYQLRSEKPHPRNYRKQTENTDNRIRRNRFNHLKLDQNIQI